ncbi:MAG TPA: DUF5668 domain-containing protein [Thermoanaerobaculia bacterium]|nr:DUF5668 domain-containing protein [Thermoanaerobaculia bacterium]
MNPAESWAPQPEPVVSNPAPLPAASPRSVPAVGQKNPWIAAFLSLFPGVGNIYNGLYMRGLIFFLIVMSCLALANREEAFGVAVAFFWIFNVLDAYRQATLINYGYAQDLGLVDLPKHPRAAQGGIAAGVILTLIGLVALLDQYFVIDLDWLFDNWPVALMGIGLWMIWSSIKSRRRAAGPTLDA